MFEVLGQFVLFCVAVMVSNIILKQLGIFPSNGVLRIDRTNPNKEIYRIEIDDLESLHKKKYVIIKVDPNADLSQN